VRKSARLEFICGLRAVRRARADFEALTRIANALSASTDDAPALVSTQSEQLREVENDRRRLERELAGHRARALYDASGPNAAGLRIVRHDAPAMDELRTLAQAMVGLPKAVLVGTITEPPTLLLATADDTGLDAGRLLKDSVTRVGGRGGGSSRIAQGTVPDAGRLAEAVASVLSVP